MSNFIPSISEDQAFDALGVFLQPLCGQAQILKSQSNRVSAPVGDFVELTPLRRTLLRTAGETLLDPVTDGTVLQIDSAIRLDIQVDMYGPDSAQWVAALTGLWRSSYPAAILNSLGLAPLTLSDAIQAPLTNSEMQYEDRWTLTVAVQYNPVVTVPVQSAIQLSVNRLEDLF